MKFKIEASIEEGVERGIESAEYLQPFKLLVSFISRTALALTSPSQHNVGVGGHRWPCVLICFEKSGGLL